MSLLKDKQIEREYSKLINDVENSEWYTKIDLTNRVNCYTCQECNHITKTIDKDAGVTPFMLNCEKCNKPAYSSYYRDIAPSLSPTIEWYRPTLKQTLKLNRNSPIYSDHILKGGLLHRKINQ